MPLDSIRGSLRDKGVRLTRQRQILLELIDKSGQHLDAENLYQMAKEKDQPAGRQQEKDGAEGVQGSRAYA